MSTDYTHKIWNTKYSRKPGDNIDRVAYSLEVNESRARKLQRSENIDTIQRLELQDLIKNLAREGKSVVEIVKRLNAMEEYSKYADYFVGYAENAIRKMPKFKKPSTNKGNDENDSDER